MIEKKSRRYISASQINDFLFCPLVFKFSYVYEMPKAKSNVYMLYGSALHAALAFNFQPKIETGADQTSEAVVKEFQRVFREGLEECEVRMHDNPEALLVTGENVLYAYMEDIAPQYKPVAVEQRFEIDLKKYPVTIMGFIDLVLEDGRVIDHKTVGKKSDWSQTKVDNSVQLTMYALAYRKLYKKIEGGLQIDVLPRANKPKFSFLQTKRTHEDIVALIELMKRMDEMTEKDVFYPNLCNCQYCPLKEVCNRSAYSPKLKV